MDLRRKLFKKAFEEAEVPAKNNMEFMNSSYSSVYWETCFDSTNTVAVGESAFRVYETRRANPLYVLHHGAGHAALTWALFAKSLKSLSDCSILCFDARGHGATVTPDDSQLSLEQLSDDLIDVVNAAYPAGLPEKIILVGHSMGGAVVTHVAAKKAFPNLFGLVVIDVVEGTALEALPRMNDILSCRPVSFSSIEEAIRYSVEARLLKNLESARVSIPPQLVRDMSGLFRWRTDLRASAPFWESWFRGLSEKFLSTSANKLLILVDTDRLDNVLLIGQMQGKFQLVLLSDCSHSIHEDAPEKVACAIHEFVNRRLAFKVPSKKS